MIAAIRPTPVGLALVTPAPDQKIFATLAAILESAAHHVDHAKYIARTIAQAHEDEKGMAKYERDRHHKIAVKAAASRKARRAAKAVAA